MKRIITTLLQAGVTAGLLWWIFRDAERREMMAVALREANFWWLLPGIAAIAAAIALQTWRWQLLLAAQEIRPGWRRIGCLNLIGMFFNLFLPGGTGGDIVKIYYAMREAPQRKMAALLSVIVDRVIGLLGLIVVACAVSLLALPLLWSHELTRALLGVLVLILGGAGAVILGAILVDLLGLGGRLPSWLPLREKIAELAAAFGIFARDRKRVGAAFLLSVPVHLLIFSTYFFAARSLGSPLELFQIFSVLPIVLTIASLPISLAGIGVREELLQQTLGALFQTPEGLSVLIGFTGFAMLAFWGLVGGGVYLFYRSSDHGETHLADMRDEVRRFEKEIEP